MSAPLLPAKGRRWTSSAASAASSAAAVAEAERRDHHGGPHITRIRKRSAGLCLVYVLMSASGPILLDWVKRSHGGRFQFAVPALTFHAWAVATCIGLGWVVASLGRRGLRQLNQPDKLWRFCITTSLFTAGDVLSFTSMQHLDVGTFSLVGKSFAIVITMVLSRFVLRKPHTKLQHFLVVVVALSTVVFCLEEQAARSTLAAAAASAAAVEPRPAGEWLVGLVQRASAVGLTSLGAVLQESLLTRDRSIPFMMQQVWMGCGAMLMSVFTLRCVYRLPMEHLLIGFGDWRVLVLLGMYVSTGLMTGLVVKNLGAVAKALCVPVYLGGCYVYAVWSGTAALTPQVITAWSASTACVLLFAVSKAAAHRRASGAAKSARVPVGAGAP